MADDDTTFDQAFKIGETIRVRFDHCGQCGKGFIEMGLVNHLVKDHGDWVGARRALRKLHQRVISEARVVRNG